MQTQYETGVLKKKKLEFVELLVKNSMKAASLRSIKARTQRKRAAAESIGRRDIMVIRRLSGRELNLSSSPA